jgi:hypothetical protein
MTKKEKIIIELINTLISINLNGIKTQFPINIYFIQPNLNLFKEEIFNAIKKNINIYSEIMLSQLLLILIDRKINCPKEIFNLILDKLIEKRKDPTLKRNIELRYKKDININCFKKLKDYKRNILWSEILIDINYPILRGFGYNIYTIKDIFYKEYMLPEGQFIYSAKIIKKPKFLITGHTKEQGIFKDYKYSGKLPKEPVFPKLNSEKEKIKYTINLILKRIGVLKRIKNNQIIIITDPKYLNQKTNNKNKKILKERMFNSLKERFL